MGNHRFRLANMMPNAWFYKLKEMNRPNNNSSSSTRAHPIPASTTRRSRSGTTHAHHNPLPNQITQIKASYYFPSDSPLHPKALDTHFPPETPNRKPPRKPISPRPIISTTSSSRNSTSESDSCTVCKITSSADHITFHVRGPEKKQQRKKLSNGSCGGNAANSPARLRMQRASSPGLAVAKKVGAVQRAKLQQRRCLSESMAVVKNSSDPRRDFRESMMEMIRENNLRASKDLEELLACYLSLNSNEHHDVIVKAFEEIWFDVCESRT